MTAIENMLSQLTRVKGRNGAWTACCPAHKDKSPSLAIKEGEDGRVLIHCFGGCDVTAVVEALGMDMTALFPPKQRSHEGMKPVIKSTFFASDLMRIVHFEALVVLITAFDIANSKPVSEETRARTLLAYQRIDEVTRYTNV